MLLPPEPANSRNCKVLGRLDVKPQMWSASLLTGTYGVAIGNSCPQSCPHFDLMQVDFTVSCREQITTQID